MFDPDLLKQVSKFVNHTEIAKSLNRQHRDLKKLLQRLGAAQFILGRELVNLREQLGEAAFKQWLSLMCPKIPWEDADHLMNWALDSKTAKAIDPSS